MNDKDLSTKAAVSANPALPAQENRVEPPLTKESLSRLVGLAVGATLHNFRLDRRRRFSGRAFRLARAFFRAAAQQTENGVSPELSVSAGQFRRIATQKFGETKEGTISADVSLLNELAEREEARGGFLSPLLSTEKGKFRVRLILLSEHRDHIFAYEVMDANDTLIVRHDDELRVPVGSKIEDVLFDEIKRNPILLHRVAEYLAKGAAAALFLVLIYAILPARAQAAIRDFARDYIVSPIKRLLTGEGKPAGSNVDVSAGRDIPNARIIEERARLRLTPAMYWGYGSIGNSGAICRGNTPVNLVSLGPAELDPPFVVVRNNVIIRDNVMVKKVEFEDHDLEPGRSYTYALGKRDPATGEVMIGRMVGTTAGLCPPPSPATNKPPAIAVTVDRASGPAPLRATFKVSVFDDEPRVRPFVFDFGDGTYMLASDNPQVTHEYRYGGTYTTQVFFSDSADQGAKGLATVSVEGPPPPPPEPGAQNPWEQWRGSIPFAKATPVVGYVDDPFTVEILPRYMVRYHPNVPVASYYWSFSDCLGAPKDPVTIKDNKKNCFLGPFKEPQVTHRFEKPGTYEVNVYIVFEDGDTANYSLGSVTAIPSEKWLATHTVDAHTRFHYDQMIEAARYYPSKHP